MKNKNPKIKRNLLCFPSNNQLFMSSSSSSEVSDLPGQKQYWGCISGCWSSSPASLLSKLLCHSAISHFMEAAAWVTNQGKGVDIITPKIVVPDNFRIRDTSFCWMAKLPRSHLPDLRKGCSLVDCSTCGPGSASSCCLYAASSQWSILLRQCSGCPSFPQAVYSRVMVWKAFACRGSSQQSWCWVEDFQGLPEVQSSVRNPLTSFCCTASVESPSLAVKGVCEEAGRKVEETSLPLLLFLFWQDKYILDLHKNVSFIWLWMD